MKFLAIYRGSFYLMLTFATLVLSVDATDDNPLAMFYPLAVAVASFVAFFSVDRNSRLGPSRQVANLIALFSVSLCVLEYWYDNTLFLLAVAHWLVYLQLIKICLPKSVEDDWFLFLLGVVQVLVGGVISQSDIVGFMLMGWALSSLWVLTLFALRREAIRMARVPFGSSLVEETRGDEPYRGLFDAAFLIATVRVAVITLALGGIIFLAMPRRAVSNNAHNADAVGRHLSGFDDEVQLGQLGEILENDSVVMSVETRDLEGNRVSPEGVDSEARWRGLSLEHYDKGRWRRPALKITSYTLGFPEVDHKSEVIRQLIKLEPTDSPILFGLRPVVDFDAADKRFLPMLNEIDGSLIRGDSRAVVIDYRIDSSTNPNRAQGGESFPSPDYLRNLLQIPDDVLDQIGPIAEKLVADIDPEDRRARVRALDNYLRGPNSEFRYTLAMEAVDPTLDPVVDFLINRKEGHCEYFASALTLMARSINIPARMVNGFKGGDYNAIAGLTTVRQKHAHSWVEVLVEEFPPRQSDQAYWLTLDPTPADQRNRSVALVGGMIGNFRQITDVIRYIWVFYIVGFNADRQNRFLYGPIIALFEEAKRGFGMIWETLKVWLHFPSMESFFSLRGFLVTFTALLLLAGFIRLVVVLIRWIWRRFRSDRSNPGSQKVGNLFYRRLVQLLENQGMIRSDSETPREFARRATQFLAGRGSGSEAVVDVPPAIVEAFYRSRFGEHIITETDHRQLVARLDALEMSFHPAPPE